MPVLLLKHFRTVQSFFMGHRVSKYTERNLKIKALRTFTHGTGRLSIYIFNIVSPVVSVTPLAVLTICQANSQSLREVHPWGRMPFLYALAQSCVVILTQSTCLPPWCVRPSERSTKEK